MGFEEDSILETATLENTKSDSLCKSDRQMDILRLVVAIEEGNTLLRAQTPQELRKRKLCV